MFLTLFFSVAFRRHTYPFCNLGSAFLSFEEYELYLVLKEQSLFRMNFLLMFRKDMEMEPLAL